MAGGLRAQPTFKRPVFPKWRSNRSPFAARSIQPTFWLSRLQLAFYLGNHGITPIDDRTTLALGKHRIGMRPHITRQRH